MHSQSWIFTKASWKEKSSFLVENRDGARAVLRVRESTGGKHSFSPVEAFLGSLASCVGINLIMLLNEEGIIPDSCVVKAESLMSHTMPRGFEKIHLIFQINGNFGEEPVRKAIETAMNLACPIAVTVGKAASITWELIMATGEDPD